MRTLPSWIEEMPALIRRQDVPKFFPQFKTGESLAQLAHGGRGPQYAMISRTAWYEPMDVWEWIQGNKRVGPQRCCEKEISTTSKVKMPPKETTPLKILRGPGRPTKAEQMARKNKLIAL